MVRSRRPASLARSAPAITTFRSQPPENLGLRGFVLVGGRSFRGWPGLVAAAPGPGPPLEAFAGVARLRASVKGWIAKGAGARPRTGERGARSPQLP